MELLLHTTVGKDFQPLRKLTYFVMQLTSAVQA